MEECECLFCQNSNANLYEINNNSLLIESKLIDFADLLFEVLQNEVNEEITNYICEECKDSLVSFYCFKLNAKKILYGSPTYDAFEQFSQFLSASKNRGNLQIRSSDDSFIATFKPEDEVMYEPEQLNYTEMETHEDENMEEFYEEEEFNVEQDVEDDSQESEPEDKYIPPLSLKSSPVSKPTLFEAVKEESDLDICEDNSEASIDGILLCPCGVECFSVEELQLHICSNKLKSTTERVKSNHHEISTCCGITFKDSKYSDMHEKCHESFEAIVQHLPTYLCNYCRIMFSNEFDYQLHVEKHDAGILDDLSNEVIERGSAFEDHFYKTIISDMDEGQTDCNVDEVIFCAHCSQKNNDADQLKVHQLFFHTTTVFCPLDNRCFEGNKQIRHFAEHIKNKHPEIFIHKTVSYTCKYCKKEFSSSFEKLAHMKDCDSKKFECSHCNKRFITPWLLQRHMKQVMGEQRFSCEICSKKCVSRSDLDIHRRSHTNERPYSCSICNKSFKTSANRSSHMDIHNATKKHQCTICLEFFQTRPILRKHKKTKHDAEYQQQCICKICSKTYISRPHLLRHLKSHGGGIDLKTENIEEFFQQYLSADKLKN